MPNIPTSKDVLEARGSWRAKLKADDLTIPPGVEPPGCPLWVSSSARPYWTDIAIPLHEAGLLTPVDTMALGLLIERLAQYIALRDDPAGSNTLVLTPAGERANPVRRMAAEALKDTMALGVELGMSPRARRGLSTIKPKTKPSAGFAEPSLFAKS